MKFSLLFIVSIFILYGCKGQTSDSRFITIAEDGRFLKNGEPYYYIGTNFWY